MIEFYNIFYFNELYKDGEISYGINLLTVKMSKIYIRNLLNNAVKFTQNGAINISAECPENEKMVLLKIIDSGTGMDQQKLESLFNTSDIHSTKGTDGESGTGLGLQICYEFVLRNGGNIYVESEIGKGSCFSFTLPKA